MPNLTHVITSGGPPPRRSGLWPREGGYILVLALVLLGILFTTGSAYLNFITSSARSVRHDVASAQALALAEAGIDAALYQLNQNADYAGETNMALDTGTYTTVVTNVGTNTKRLTVTGSVPNAENPLAVKAVTVLTAINTSFVSFHYGAQVGAGGVELDNNATITGNAYSNGSVHGGGIVTGDVIVAGGSGSVIDTRIHGTVRAHSLSDCTVGGDAYYQTVSGCSIAGTLYPESVDPAPEAMPISDTQIAAWDAIAAAGTVITGNYTLNGSQTLGPARIDGDLLVRGTLLLSGVVWVKGNITFENNSGLTVSPITGNDGAILIADVPGGEASKGIVTLGNNMAIAGNGSAGSYPMILSTHSGVTAITLNNNADSVILYASRGAISIKNNAGANQITAYGLSLKNGATVTYVSGLQNQSFSNGPGGSWAIVPRTYSITR